MDFSGKVAAITGGGRGIGKSTALLLARKGCNVSLMARTNSQVMKTAKEAVSEGVGSLAIRGDVSSAKDCSNFIKRTMSKFSKIDFLINNAGIAISKPLFKTTEREWDNLIDINLKGPFLCSREVMPIMMEAMDGVIVNVSSGAGKHGFANLSAYCASKFGLLGMTESLAKEADKFGIRVYAVCPGAVATKMQDDIYGGKLIGLSKKFMLHPDRIAEKIISLCMPNSRAKTGSCVEIYF